MGEQVKDAYKAYKVSCVDDDHGATIVFAKRSKDVNRDANSDTCDCEFTDRRVNRAPEFDKYDRGGAPLQIRDCLEEGWYWECQNCEKHCYKDSNPVIVSDGTQSKFAGHVFCSLECIKKWRSEYPTHPVGYHHSIVETCVAIDAHLACAGIPTDKLTAPVPAAHDRLRGAAERANEITYLVAAYLHEQGKKFYAGKLRDAADELAAAIAATTEGR